MVLLIYIISVIIYPKKPIEYIRKNLHLNANKEEIFDDCTSYEKFTHNGISRNIYFLDKLDKSKIIIDLPGGAFIAAANTLKPFLHIEQQHPVVSIEYPVLPSGDYKTTVPYITAAIDYILEKYGNPKIILNATSAGSFYAVKIINSEKYKNSIIKFISTSGYFGYKTINNVATYITDKIYLRRLNNSTLLDCIPVPTTIDCFYAIGELDPIKISTINYLQLSGDANSAVEYPNSDHCFYNYYNKEITQSYYKDVGTFINL